MIVFVYGMIMTIKITSLMAGYTRKKSYKKSYGRKAYGGKKKYGSGKKLYYNKSRSFPSQKFVKLVAKALKKSPAQDKGEFKAKNTKLFNVKGGYFAWKPNRKALELISQPGSPWQKAAYSSTPFDDYQGEPMPDDEDYDDDDMGYA